MSAFTKPELAVIRQDLEQAFATIAKKHKLITLKIGNITFDAHGGFVSKLEGVKVGGESKEAQRYAHLCAFESGLPPLGAKLHWNGMTMEVIGANTTCSKVLARAIGTPGGGLVYTLRVQSVIDRWARQQSEVQS